MNEIGRSGKNPLHFLETLTRISNHVEFSISKAKFTDQ